MEQAKAMHEHVKNAGKEAGIEFNFDDSKVANSYRGHLLIQLAKSNNLGNEMEEVIGKTRDEILSGVSAEEVATLLNLIRKLEQNILDLQAKD